MSNYILITPEITDTLHSTRKIGKTFVASAIVTKLRIDGYTALYVDESEQDTNFDTRTVNDDILNNYKLRGKVYDYIVIAGLTKNVETAFRTLRKVYYPEFIKTIKVQSLS